MVTTLRKIQALCREHALSARQIIAINSQLA
jgi:hypothetical protein